MKRTWIVIAVLAITLTVLLGGCADNLPVLGPGGEPTAKTGQGSAAQPEKESSGQETAGITVYYATKDAMFLVAEVNKVNKSEYTARKAIEFLIAGPHKAELAPVLPPGTELKGIRIKDGVAFVDFNDKIVKNGVGGSASEILAVGAIVNTLTEFSEVHKVQIMVEGKKIETLYGHMDLSEPLSRSEQIIKK